MYCTHCGTRNDDSATTCIQCGNALRPPTFGSTTPPPVQPTSPQQQYQAPIAQAYVPPQAAAPAIPNYLVQAILVTVLCCLPFGIVSIIFASQVNSKAAAGDIAGAMNASRQAKLFAWIGFGLGGGFVVLWVLLAMLGMVGSLATHAH